MTDPLERLRSFWNDDAATYDLAPSHSLSDPAEAAGWRAALVRHLPPPPSSVLDIGAGTGSMALLAAELGYRVTAADLSEAMLAQAREKARARGLELSVHVGPATEPPPGQFYAVIERHVLWTLPDPVAALAAWRSVAPAGRLVVFESVFARNAASRRLREGLVHTLRKLRGDGPEHRGRYDAELLALLPLALARSPRPILEAVQRAGWRDIRIERLRDVERARRAASGAVLGWLGRAARYAVTADA